MNEEHHVIAEFIPNQKLVHENGSKYAKCVDHRSQFFIQYACEMNETENKLKFIELSQVACILSFAGAIFALLLIF